MTRQEIVDLIKTGWNAKDYISGQYTELGNTANLNEVKQCCAIGAAAYAGGYTTAGDFAVALEAEDWDQIVSISDSAFSKGAAIEKLEAWAAQ